MNNIVKWNTYLLNCIIIGILLILILVLSYKIWNKYVGKKLRINFNFSKKEDFSQVTLEKQVQLYDDYRNYLEGKELLYNKCGSNKRMIPYIVSPNCFTDKYVKCMKEKSVNSKNNEANIVSEPVFMHSEEKLNGFNDMYNDKFIDKNYYTHIDSNSNTESESNSETVSHDNIYTQGFEASSKNCQDQSYDMCLTDNFNFV